MTAVPGTESGCTSCGAAIRPDAQFCASCGSPFASDPGDASTTTADHDDLGIVLGSARPVLLDDTQPVQPAPLPALAEESTPLPRPPSPASLPPLRPQAPTPPRPSPPRPQSPPPRCDWRDGLSTARRTIDGACSLISGLALLASGLASGEPVASVMGAAFALYAFWIWSRRGYIFPLILYVVAPIVVWLALSGELGRLTSS